MGAMNVDNSKEFGRKGYFVVWMLGELGPDSLAAATQSKHAYLISESFSPPPITSYLHPKNGN
jgi:hypothetical protein